MTQEIKPMAGKIEQSDWAWSLGCIKTIDPSVTYDLWPPWASSFPVTQVRIEIQSGPNKGNT
jgi:hypothetical protein